MNTSYKPKGVIIISLSLIWSVMVFAKEPAKKIVAEQLSTSGDQISNTSSFVDDLGADSLDTVELVMALEEEFDLEIPDDEAEKITTVQQAVDHINSATG